MNMKKLLLGTCLLATSTNAFGLKLFVDSQWRYTESNNKEGHYVMNLQSDLDIVYICDVNDVQPKELILITINDTKLKLPDVVMTYYINDQYAGYLSHDMRSNSQLIITELQEINEFIYDLVSGNRITIDVYSESKLALSEDFLLLDFQEEYDKAYKKCFF